MEFLRLARGTVKVTRKIFTRRRLIVGGLLVGAFLIISPIFTYFHFSRDIANRQRLMNRDNTGIIIKDKNGEVLYNYGNINGYPELQLEEISDNLEQAVIASEDQEFYNHEGYSAKGILRAVYANLLNKNPMMYGGSTITQQLVKNKLLGKEKNYFRKYQEVTMAVAVERKYSKREIMEMYLNSVYFGEGAFGIAAAAETYFNKPAEDLTLAESTMLVGLLPAPSAFSPVSGDKQEAKERQEWVLSRMVKNGYIDEEQKQSAENKNIKYASRPKEPHNHAQHFVMMVLDELKEKYGEENIARGGFEVTTTLDLNWQKQSEQRIKDQVEKIKVFGANNASMVAIDPRSGEIRALVGSVDWNNPKYGKVNMALGPRQPGSSFKPIYYTEALDKRLVTAATVLEDEPKKFGDYQPQNFDFKFRGSIPLRYALAQSLNIPAIEVMQKLGVDEASKTAQRMGIQSVNEPEKYGLSLALGTAEVTVLDMTKAYSAFANNGEQYEAHKVVSIKDKFDNDIFEAESKKKRVMSKEASFLISSILSDNKARAATFGNSLTVDGKQAAVKTGTTDDSRDAWTMGYTPDLTVGVWVGNNQNKPMEGLMGSTSAGAIWRDTVSSFAVNQNGDVFKPTNSIVHTQICLFGSMSAVSKDGPYEEYFIKGTEPDSCLDSKEKEKDKPKRREEENEGPSQERENNQGNGNNNSGSGGRGGGVGGPGQVSEPEEPTEEPPTDPEEPPAEEEPTDSTQTSGG